MRRYHDTDDDFTYDPKTDEILARASLSADSTKFTSLEWSHREKGNSSVYRVVTTGTVQNYHPRHHPPLPQTATPTTVQLEFFVTSQSGFDSDSGAYLAPTSVKVCLATPAGGKSGGTPGGACNIK